jgi:transposase
MITPNKQKGYYIMSANKISDKNESKSDCATNHTGVINEILCFMQLFICETLSKRIICVLLLTVDVPIKRIAELVNLSEKSVRHYKRTLESDGVRSLLTIRGGGRKSNLAGIESMVMEEIETNNYHSRQQIADMIKEKHGIKISVSAVGKLLKKTASNA